MVEEASAATHSLDQEVTRLVDLVGGFRLRDEGRPQPAAPKPSVRRSAPVSSRRHNLAVVHQDWEEF
jgi:hypothetical protein